ncbi:MAG: hypothetical protein Q9157_004509 [Trypethelium eluteriae]
MATSGLEDSTDTPSLDRVPSAPSRPTLSNAGRPLLRRLDSSAGGLFKPPTLTHLKGRWHVTHSTLPIWKDKKNVTITYTILPDKKDGSKGLFKKSGSEAECDASIQEKSVDGIEGGEGEDGGVESHKLEDVIEYQEHGKSKVCTVKGVDTISAGDNTSAWNWRGKGIIKIASSHWEILGWGVDNSTISTSTQPQTEAGEKTNGTVINGYEATDGPHERQWMVTYFAKTYFTPAGMDIYSRHPDGVSEKLFDEIRQALTEIDAPHLAELAGKLYQVGRDGDREF